MDEQKPQSTQENITPSDGGVVTPPQSAMPSQTPPPPAQATPPSVPPAAPHERRFPWIVILIVVFVGFLGLAVWYFQSQLKTTVTNTTATPTTAAVTTIPKELTVGTDPTFQPMEYMQNGKMVGYDIDLANLLAKQLGVKVVFKNITFDSLFQALDQKQIDMIIAAVTINPQRQKKYDFSEGYINAGEVIITQKTNTIIKTTKDLNGKKIGVQQGTTDEAQALKYTAKNLVIEYPDFVHATTALVGGQIDAIITDLPSAQGIVSDNPTLKIASDPFTNEYYGIVFRKGDPIQKPVNQALDSLRVRGYLTELKQKWLY